MGVVYHNMYSRHSDGVQLEHFNFNIVLGPVYV